MGQKHTRDCSDSAQDAAYKRRLVLVCKQSSKKTKTLDEKQLYMATLLKSTPATNVVVTDYEQGTKR